MSKSTFSWTKIENKLGQSKNKKHPFIANSYVVSFGSVVTSFSKISGISLKTTEYTAINEGGRDTPYILLDQGKNFNTITFERGLGIGFQGSTLTDMLQFVEKIRIRDMLLIIYGNTPEEKKAYYTDTAYVKDIVLSDLNATSQEVLIQSMTIVYDVFKESKDDSASNRGQNNNPSTVSNVGTVSGKKNSSQSSNDKNALSKPGDASKAGGASKPGDSSGAQAQKGPELKTAQGNGEIKKASEQNSAVNQNEQAKLEAQNKVAADARQQKEQACFIDNILNTIEGAVDSVDKAVSQVEKGVDKAVGEVVNRIEKFGEIIEKAEKVVDKVEKLDEIPGKAVEKIEKAVEEVVEKKEKLEETAGRLGDDVEEKVEKVVDFVT